MISSQVLQIINLVIRYVTPHNYLKKLWPQYLKQRIIKKGMVGPILLLPEFCLLSDLSDQIRSYFPVMKDQFYHTQISSAGRAQEIEPFMNDL